jgi:molecular chaperone DnaK (HSP70)
VCRARGRTGSRRRRPLEAGAEHPGARALNTDGPYAAVGIDLGTTNTALASAPARGAIHVFDVPQLVAAGEVDARPTLPSFLYLASQAERDAGVVRLPWDPAPDLVAGVFARDEGALVPHRQISSAKSWLSNARVDRRASLLPWGAEEGPTLSPVEASARLLAHLREAWNHRHASDGARLEQQAVVLTVPASFDEEARELTVEAARAAGLSDVTLLEEPLAALYAWIAANRRAAAAILGGGALILVCDVGGGTTDFSLIRADLAADGELTFERIAIGEHLLLGGDNLDLTLAVHVERKLGEAAKLSISQRQILRRKCSAAKEQLLSGAAGERAAITLLGTGRGVVGGGMTTELTRGEVIDALTGGFLPLTAPDDLPARDRRLGLRELGLPFESEPAITRHLAGFLARSARDAGGAHLARPSAVLFNGGFFTPPVARDRVLEALTAWSGERPTVLQSDRPEAAVAIGAAFYGRLRRTPDASKRLLIRAGSARTYYVGVETEAGAEPAAVCVMPRGTEEGTRLALDREFTVMTNVPAAFSLYSSSLRSDPPNTLVTLGELEDARRHAPLVTAFRFGKRSRRVPLAIRLAAVFTEVGTLELWCESGTTDHRWRLAFNLRGVEADPLQDDTPPDPGDTATVVIGDAALAEATSRIDETFGADASRLGPEALVGELENALGHAKGAWPLTVIRQVADVLIARETGRRRSAAHEARWLNLTGFCLRPGFGSALDEWRVSEMRKVYATGLAFPREIQNQVEWLVLWQRVGAGFGAGQQRELAQRVSGQLGLGQRKPARLNPQVERESWRLLASLERLDAGQRSRFGELMLERVRREPRNASWLWALGRLGGRVPLYGPLNTVVPPATAAGWLTRLLALKALTPDVAAAAAQIGARTDDPARDVPHEVAERAAAQLEAAGFEIAARQLRTVSTADRVDAGRVFGESLPEGLRLG